jgi:iron complex transport system permease protein
VLAAGVWLTAACVAHVGPIAFVGLLVPHGVRLVFGAAHCRVLPASTLAGGAFLVLCDGAARTLPMLGRGAEAPVGVVTALVGGPVFLAMLARKGRDRY